MQKILLSLLLVSVAIAAQAQAPSGKKFQCWTDDKGQRACGDRVPPQYAKDQRQVYDAQGRVVETKQREKTPEEVAEAQRLALEAAETKRKQEADANYDRFLLDTYSSTKDLERSRNERFATLDGRRNLAQKAVADDEASLAGLNTRIANIRKNGKEPDPNLLKQVRGVEKTLSDNRHAIEQIQKDRADIDAKFTRDIQRYQELRAAKP